MRRDLLCAAIVLAAALAGCAGGGGGGGGGGGSHAGGSSGSGGLRLVGLDRRLLSPGASARLALVVERPHGSAASAFTLEESFDGVNFATLPVAPARVVDGSVHWDLPMPAGLAYYRVSAPRMSNRVAVNGAAAAARSLAITSPAAGAAGVARDPVLSISGGAGAASFLFAVADEEGTLVYLADSAAPTFTLGASSAVDLVPSPGLAHGGYVATAVALDAESFGFAAAPRADFTVP